MTQPELLTFLLVLLAYLAGSIPSAVLVCNSMGISDPRQLGSRNPGASNVLRIGNKRAAAITFMMDICKGLLALYLSTLLVDSQNLQISCALAVLIGHFFPIFASFKGGKGVATAFGISLWFSWPFALLQMLCWLLIFFTSRISSVASLLTAAITPVLTWLVIPELFLPFSVISVLLIIRHHHNIHRIIKGNESSF